MAYARPGRDLNVAGELHIHPPPEAGFPPLHQLRPPPPTFTGREEELGELERELTTSGTAGATISGKHAGLQGMGGVGKTALALVLAQRLKPRYPDAQLDLNLRGADPERRAPLTPAEVMQSVIHSFHPEARLPEGLEALAPIYHAVLNEAGRVLLLLDNAAGAEQVRPLLPPANCLLLVTSRAQFTLPGLAARNLDCLPPARAQELLLKLAARLRGHEREAAELCGQLPLALEVFAGAANSKGLTPVPELLERLRARQEKLEPVEAAFQVSYELLTERLRRCWELLAVFPASFDLRAAAAVWGEAAEAGRPAPLDSAREAMQGLVNASLVEWNGAQDRFRLHDLVRQFCEDKLRAGHPATATEERTTEEQAARLRHARHYCAVGEEAEKLYLQGGENVLRGLALFDRERAHLEAAFEFLAYSLAPDLAHGGEAGRGELEKAVLLVSLVSAMADTGILRFHPRQRIRWLEAQRDSARIAKNREGEGVALGNLGLAYADLGEARKAIAFYEQRLMIAREVGDRRGEGAVLGNLGNAYAALGEARKAIEFYEQSLVIERQIGDWRGEGTVLGNLGIAYAALGEARKAIEFHEQSLMIDRETGDRRGEGADLGNLGNAYAALGEARKAIEFYEQALVIDREIGDRRGEGADLGNLGNAYADLGEARKAIEFYEQQVKIVREIGDQRGEGNSLWNSALALEKLGDRAEAIARAEAALRIYEAIEDPNAPKVRAQLTKWRAAQ